MNVLKLLPILPFTLLASAQSPVAPVAPAIPVTSGQTVQTSSDPGLLRLHVLVTDKSGHAVTNLPQSDFVLRDNGQPVPLLSFQSPEGTASTRVAPTEVVLVIDAVNVGVNTVEFEREQIDRFLRRNEGQLPVPVSVVIFTDTSSTMQPIANQDGNALAASLDKETIGLRELRRSAGYWGATERLNLSVSTLRKLLSVESTRPGHKLILWISPGWPLLSGPGVDLDRKEQDQLFSSVVDLNQQLQQAQVTLYSIDPLGVADAGGFRPIYYQSFLKGVSKPSQTQLADLSLQVLATHSGGRASYGNNDIEKVIADTVAEANRFYTITVPRHPTDQANTYHDLQLKLEQPGLTASTTTGYYTMSDQHP